VTQDERRKILSFVVVGGGPTGIEFAGELSDLARREIRRVAPEISADISITVVEAGSEILSVFSQTLRRYAMRAFARQKITVRTASRVKEVREDAVVLSDGEVLPAGMTIWSAGIRPTDLAQSITFSKDTRGRIVVNSYLQTADHQDIFALGDCSFIPGKEYPTTAQVAQQQGKYLGKALNVWAKGGTPRPFWYFHQGMLAYVGNNKGLAETPAGGLRGWMAWIMWRWVYLTKLVSLRNKVLVVFDWLKARLFGRDLSQF
jgi:NADH:ubiquinone reductase (non-electrogenic)